MQVILPAWAIWEWFISPAGASPVWIQTLQLAQTLQLCAALCTHLKKKKQNPLHLLWAGPDLPSQALLGLLPL